MAPAARHPLYDLYRLSILVLTLEAKVYPALIAAVGPPFGENFGYLIAYLIAYDPDWLHIPAFIVLSCVGYGGRETL
jgi:hypothetical protein